MAFAPVVTFKENTAGRAASTAEPSPISTEAQMDRSTSSNPSLPLSPESRPQLDMEVVESTNSAAFMLLTVPRERSSPQGLRGPSPSCYGPLPTVLGRRDCSKSSSKSIAACYQLNPSSPQSGSLGLPRSPNTSSWLPARFRREVSEDGFGPSYLDTAAASRESDITLRKWSVGVRTLLQLQEGHFAYWILFFALTSVLLVVTALYAVFMAPRDDLQTIDWRLRHDLTEQPEPGCIVADHAGFYSILAASAVAGCAACLMFVNAGHSAHILSAAGYALLNWFQGLVAAILPAHERAKNGCAYGMMQKTFAPQEMSSYDNVDYYKEYYGVIIVRTLLFLVGLIWMQHLMVRRVLAVETTSRRYLGGKCLATNIAVQKVAAIVACGVSVWIYTSLDDVEPAPEVQEAAASLHFLGHVSFWQRCSQCTYFVGLLFFQLILGGLNVILFIGTAVTVLVVMRIILRDLSKALVVTNEFAQTHPRTRRAGQQLKRARTVVRRQLAGVALNVLASFGVVPLAVKTILDGRGYISEQELALRTAAQVLDIASCVAAALILSGGYRRPVEGRKVPVSQGDAAEPCTCQFATLESVQAKPPNMTRASTSMSVSGLLRSSSAWKAKVMDLAERGVTVRELLSFYRNLKTVMPHFRPSIHTTHDVVRHAIIPMTKHKKTSYVQAFSERVQQPGKMVTHWWGNRFVDLIAAVVADALEESSYGLVSRLLQKEIDVIEKMLERCDRLDDCYWICAFCVNQHAAICDHNHDTKDSLTGLPHPLCDCGLPKHLGRMRFWSSFHVGRCGLVNIRGL
ncbi:unnamed protein product [Durusdinium trenchii]|uniref:Uncharacterized protein n=1 Tax=Durusdinium trenchii TaxID=1381693 RepID=A0ABP0MXC8_9DINO